MLFWWADIAEILIFEPLERTLWLIAIVILLLCNLYYFFRSFKVEMITEKRVMMGFASFFLGLAFTRIFYFVSDFYLIGGNRDGHFYYADKNNPSEIAFIMLMFGNSSFLIGMTFLFFTVELVIKRTKYILTCCSALSIVLPFIDVMFVFILVPTYMFLYIAILLWFGRSSSFEFQTVSGLMITGGMLLLVGSFFYAMAVDETMSLSMPLIITPIFYMAGALFIISPAFISPEFYSRPLKKWIIFLVACIFVSILCLTLLISLGIDFWYFLAFLFGFFLFAFLSVFALFNVIKTTKSQEAIQEQIDESQDILRIFTKRRKLTEEEVSVSKEKKICLVCKEKLSRSIYLCPDCDALYCSRCAGALSSSENACWVCETPIDDSKPVNVIHEIDEESLVVNEDK